MPIALWDYNVNQTQTFKMKWLNIKLFNLNIMAVIQNIRLANRSGFNFTAVALHNKYHWSWTELHNMTGVWFIHFYVLRQADKHTMTTNFCSCIIPQIHTQTQINMYFLHSSLDLEQFHTLMCFLPPHNNLRES